MPAPETRYAKSGDANIAYQVLGDGPVDLVYVWGFISHLDFQWTEPRVASFLERLAGFSRLIMFDKRGMGLSDPLGAAPTFEERMDDILAVMDTVGSERAALIGFSEGTALSALFAVTHPERTSALVLYDGFAVGPLAAPEAYGWEPKLELIDGGFDNWGEGHTIQWAAPSMAGNAVFRRFWAAFERAAMARGSARAVWELCARADVRDALPSIAVPTLVINHADSFIPAVGGRRMAEAIPGARYLEMPGRDHVPGASDSEALAAEIEQFLTGSRGAARPDRVLTTVLFTDVVDSTRRAAELGDGAWRELRVQHDAVTRAAIERFRGREIKQTGDGFVASFDGPARAIRCACAIRSDAREIGLVIRAGVHTGECEVLGADLAGIAVHVAARVGALAQPGQVLASGTVRDLVMGSGIEFVERGSHELKGVPGRWPLFAVGHDGGTRRHAAAPAEPRPRLGDRAARRVARRAPGLVRFGARVLGSREGA